MVETERLKEMLATCDGVTPGPWRGDTVGMYLWAPSAKDGDFPLADGGGHDALVARMRGWGYYTGNGSGGLGLSADEAVKATQRDLSFIANCDPGTIREILSELIAAHETGWQDIASAPKDREIDLWCEPHDAFEVGNACRFTNCRYNGSWGIHVTMQGWRSIEEYWTPTHWMAIPSPPSIKDTSK